MVATGTLTGFLATGLLVGAVLTSQSASAAGGPPVGLGTAATYSVLGGQAVTNTGPSVLGGDLGVHPGDAITGFPPGTVGGATHAGDASALQAQSDLVVAYDDAAGRATDVDIAGDLVGQTLTGGVYTSSGPIAVSGTLTLDAEDDPTSTFIFQVASTLITASASDIVLLNGAQACNVFWQVGSSATLGTDSDFTGTIMALTSISVTSGTDVVGRALARNGAVTLDNNTFTSGECDNSIPTETPTETEPPTDTPTDTSPPTDTPSETTNPTDTGSSPTPSGGTPGAGDGTSNADGTPSGDGPGPSGSGGDGPDGSSGPGSDGGRSWSGQGGTGTQNPSALARSGTSSAALVAMAAGSLAVGGTGVLLARRRQS